MSGIRRIKETNETNAFGTFAPTMKAFLS